MSLNVEYRWNGILSISDEIPTELFDPVSWTVNKWTTVSAAINELVEIVSGL